MGFFQCIDTILNGTELFIYHDLYTPFRWQSLYSCTNRYTTECCVDEKLVIPQTIESLCVSIVWHFVFVKRGPYESSS